MLNICIKLKSKYLIFKYTTIQSMNDLFVLQKGIWCLLFLCPIRVLHIFLHMAGTRMSSVDMVQHPKWSICT